MKNVKTNVKRILSVFMTLAMLFTTVVFFDVSASAATLSAINVTDNGNGNPVYLYVPEQIYLKPQLNSYKTQARYNFQWFVDSAVNTSTHVATPNTGERSAGNFYFYYADATKVTISFKFLNANGTEMTAFTSSGDSTSSANYANQNCSIKFNNQSSAISASNTRTSATGSQYIYNSNTVNTTMTQEGFSPFLLASTTGCYIEWTVRFIDGRDGLTRVVKAYTYIYKPLVQPVGVGVRSAEEFWDDEYNQHIAWVSGVHSIANTGDYYPKSTGGQYSLVPFSSSGPDGYTVGDLKMQFANSVNHSSAGYFDYTANNEACNTWFDSSSTNFTVKSFNWASSANPNPSGTSFDLFQHVFVASPLATLRVDNSRYTNLSQIPNLSVGMMITDDEKTDSGAAQFIKNFSTGTTADTRVTGNDWDKSKTNSTTIWEEGNGTSIFSAGTLGSGGTSESEGVKYNGRWKRDISTSSASGRYDLRTGSWMHKGKDWTTGVGGIHVQINMVNNTSLRTALANAYKITGRLGIDVDGNSPYYDTTTAAWKNFVALYQAAGKMLTAVDFAPTVTANGTSYSSPSTLADALTTAINNIETARRTATAQARVVALTTDYTGNYVTDYVTTKAAGTYNKTESKTYKYGNNVSVNVPDFPGYEYVGYANNMSTTYGRNLGTSYASVLTSTDAPAAANFTSASSLQYTLFYIPKTLTATVKTNSGTYNLLKAQTGDLPSLAGIGFPSHAANPSATYDFNYRIVDNDVIASTASATTAQKYVYLPFYGDLSANTEYLLTYSVAGTDAENIEFSFYNADFFGGDTGNTSNYTVGTNGKFKTGAYDSGRAYLKLEISGSARSGKEFRISDLCLTEADKNVLYYQTSTEYPASFTPTSAQRTGMTYTASGLNSLIVTSKYSTLSYEQKQLVPYYVDVQGGCTYEFSCDISSSLNTANIVFELYNASFTGGNGTEGASYYAFAGSGSTVTIAATDSGTAQLRVSYVPKTVSAIASGTTATITNLYIENLTSQTVVTGKTNETFTLGIPVRSGYKFTSWSVTGATSATANGDLVQNDDTLYYNYVFGTDSDNITANWSDAKYTVVFRNYDGTVYKTQEVTKGGNASAPTGVTPTFFGHTFAGWDTTFTNVQKHLYVEPIFDPIDINVSLSKASTEIHQRGTDTVTASFTPADQASYVGNVVWTSSNPSVATVSGSGTQNKTATITGGNPGNATITATVEYDGRTYSNSMTVTVNKVIPTGAEISRDPNKTTYFVGETFDPTGLQLKVTYNNGEVKYYDYGTSYDGITITLSNISTATASTKTLTVTFKEGTTTLRATTRITVQRVVLESIEIVTLPEVTEYYVGDYDLDPSGIEVVAHYNNGTTEDVDADLLEFSDLQAAAPGTETIIVSYQNKTTSFDVTIKALVLESIAVKTLPKTTYYVGDSESTAGLTITATYSNGATEVVSTGFTTSGFSSATAGQKTITVTYQGKTTTYKVNVLAVELTSITVKTPPTKTSYFVGDAEDFTGLVITANYNNGTTVDLTEGFTTAGFNSLTAGQKTVVVTYQGKTTSFNVNVVAVELTGITIKKMPTKTSYYVGDAADFTGLTITATYNNGTSADLTEGFTTSGFSSATAGQKTVTVNYNGKTATFNVTVNAVVLTGITIKTQPAKTTYFVGDTADFTGLVITASYNNGTSEDLTTGFTTTGFDSNTAGMKTITVNYNGKTAMFSVNVNPVEITGIVIKSQPAKTTYFVGETADYTGLVITASYNNGTSEDLTTGFTTTGFSSATAGQKTVTVTYKGKTATFTMTVNAIELTDIVIKSQPAKTSYFVGDTADYTGLVVTANYNNGTSEDLTTGFTTTGFDSATAGQQTITVSYNGKTATFTVNVVAIELTGIVIKSEPTKKIYLLDEEADYAGLVVTANYNNGTSEDLTTGFTVTGFTSATVGQKPVTINYNGKTATFYVTVEMRYADYTELDALVEYFNDLDPDDYENYDDIYWIYIYDYIENYIPDNHDYVYTRQDEVDAMKVQLQEYIDMLIPVGAVVEESFSFVGTADCKEVDGVKYAFGFKTLMTKTQLNNYVECENVSVQVEFAQGTRYIGTGSVIKVVSDKTGEVIDEYVVVIYGDVDGNARIDSSDALAIKLALSGLGDVLAGAAKQAANVYGSRPTINSQDADALSDVARNVLTIDQVTGKVAEA